MKIAMFDPYNGKFTEDMQLWWRRHGHEVRFDHYYNPEMVVWGDVVWFDTCDNNLLSATNPDQALKDEWKYSNRPGAWDMHEMDLSQKKIICRPIDIEVWQGHHAHSNMWELVNDCIFFAPYIRDMMMADSRPQENPNMRTHVIPGGLDLDKWTWRDRQPGRDIAVVAERWVSKGIDYVLQIALKLGPDYRIHWLGRNNDYHWEHEYLKDFITHNNLNLILYEDYVEDLDTWLDDKQYILSGSHKETFGYNIAEGMSKGLKPIIHRFYGADAIWPNLTWNSIDQAVDLIKEDYMDSTFYRQYLYNHGYDIDSMMNKIMEVINA